jgi:predicted MPP superfamily phosphohydrolase
MTGDMVDSTDNDFSVFLSLVATLSEKYSLYYIVGNHEQSLKDNELERLYDKLGEYPICILDNELTTIEKDGESINIYGLWVSLLYYSNQTNQYVKKFPEIYTLKEDTITKAIGEFDDSQFGIVLTHNPLYFETYCEWGGDLILCGHIHGGMIRIPFIGGVLSPDNTFFPTYDAGLFSSGDHNMIVSRGLGSSIGFRVFNSPEVVAITLHRS